MDFEQAVKIKTVRAVQFYKVYIKQAMTKDSVPQHQNITKIKKYYQNQAGRD